MTVTLDHEQPVAGTEIDDLRRQVDNLRLALETSRMISMAVGILIERFKVSPDEAFDCLAVVSQNTHRKLREIASDLVFSGELPPLAARVSA